MPLKIDKTTIEKHFKDALEAGALKGHETNSNWVEFWYWLQFSDMKIFVNGEEFGLHNLGKLSKIIANGETVRTVWSKMRAELKLKQDTESQQEFKEE